MLPCKIVVQRASCNLQRKAGFHVTDARAPLRWLWLGSWRTRKLAACACRAALDAIGTRAIKGHCSGGRLLSFSARPWCDV